MSKEDLQQRIDSLTRRLKDYRENYKSDDTYERLWDERVGLINQRDNG